MRARVATADEVRDWDRLVARFPGRRVTHRQAWIRSLAQCGLGVPLHLVLEQERDVVGCLPGLISRMGPLLAFGSPLPGWQTASMGPLYDAGRVRGDDVVTACLRVLEGQFGVHHVELVSDRLDGGGMASLGFEEQPVPTFRAALHPGDEARTFRQLRDSARRNVHRAGRLGLDVRFESDAGFAREAYGQIRDVFIRGGNVVPFGLARVEAFLACMHADGSLAAVSVRMPGSQLPIACGLFTVCDDELLLWQWAHRPEHRWYRATEVLTWTVMRHAMAQGCTTFDLMGEGTFKANFGAALQWPHRRWIRSRYRWLRPLRHAAERGYRWQQGVRGRVARWTRAPRAGRDDSGSAAAQRIGDVTRHDGHDG